MSDIATGTVYKIICKLDHKFVYIGSSFDTLRNRWQNHKRDYIKWLRSSNADVRCSCYPYFKQFGIENFKMIEIKSYDIHLKDRRCLEALETLWICKTRGCCNRNLPVSYLKKEQKKAYREANKTEIAEVDKERYKANRKEILEQKKVYQKAHKTEISERKKVKVQCRCGSSLRKADMARHCRSAKHQAFLATQIE